jgi:hypothetical protein
MPDFGSIYLSNRNTVIKRAGDWYLHSGIQESQGGVARFRRTDLGRNARVSSEITGYSISFLVYAFERTADPSYLEAARKSAQFLIRHVWDSAVGLFPFEHSFNGSQPEPLAYFFDSGIIVRSLLALWRATGEPEFLVAASLGGRGMLSHFKSRQSFHPIVRLPMVQALDYEPQWSASPGCYQLKSAMAWLELFEETGDEAFRQGYEDTLAQALDNGPVFLPGAPSSEKVMDRLHAFAYFLEGLLPVGDRPECVAAFRCGIAKLAGYLREIEPIFVRSDVYAQLLRLRLFAHTLGLLPLDEAAACFEAKAAATFEQAHGGFGFGRKRGQDMPFENPVSTAFCAQALDLWNARNHADFVPRRNQLV